MSTIILPWPPSLLSGHAKGNGRWAKIKATKDHREWAHSATMAARPHEVPASGDVLIRITFIPPNRLGDRTNFPNRLKPAIDGIAQALGINDSRFLPSYAFATPEKPGRVEVQIGDLDVVVPL